jgi:aminoglycoside phosphotransferase (APT) family kinase protein
VRYVHQRLNTSVFPDPASLMANVARVTSHLGTRGGLRLVPASDGSAYAVDVNGGSWRTFAYVDGARTWPRFSGPDVAREAGRAAAGFVADLADLPGPPLPEVIPGFHDVGRRLDDLRRAADADPVGRGSACGAEVEAVQAHGGLAAELASALGDGRLPERAVHNDAKADNVLFDQATGAALCLADLDTVGPGTVVFDVGDLVRSGAASGDEDGDPSGVGVRLDVVRAVMAGYVAGGRRFLTDGEIGLLALGGPLMALEAAARFLTDHLEGDVYFRVGRGGHNLARARNQLRLVQHLEALRPRVDDIVAGLRG